MVTVTREKEGSRELSTGSGTVLLVDDEATVLEVGTGMLTRLGYEVLQSSNGRDAITRLLEDGNRIDLVILDLIMPGMNGGEVYDRMREISKEVRILLSSGYSIDGQAQAILDRGCNGFIQKPFDVQTLSEKIRDVMA